MGNEIKEINNEIIGMEFVPFEIEEVNLNMYTKLSFDDLKNILGLKEQGEKLLKLIPKEITGTYAKESRAADALYHVTIPDGFGKLSKLLNDGRNFVAENVLSEKGTIRIPCDPHTIFMSALLLNIESRLDDIEETQQDILSFLVNEKESESKGNFKSLADIFNSYKYNWDNDKFRDSRHVKVLDIQNEAEKNIEFYYKSIIDKLEKRKTIHIDADVQKNVSAIQNDLVYYRLSLYLYSFATFLDILLSETFESGYLKTIIEGLETRSFRFRDTYTKCFNALEAYSDSSIDKYLMNGLADASQSVGKVLGKIPLANKVSVDNALISTGQKLRQLSNNKLEKVRDALIQNKNSDMSMFIDYIIQIDKLYNSPTEIILAKDAIYVG